MAAATTSPLVQRVRAELAKFPSLDPNAVLAIGGHEGLSGGVGDNGTSFGFAQLHQGGALPAGIGSQGPAAAQQWAWSPSGIDYALSKMAQVAGGLKGLPAIEAISRRFERPANPEAEIADAAAHYGSPLGGGSSVFMPSIARGAGAAGVVPPARIGPSPAIAAALRLLGYSPGMAA